MSKANNKTAAQQKSRPNIETPTRRTADIKQPEPLVFGRENYKWMLIGIVVMVIGFICMAGGAMPSPDVWQEDLIYSPVRILYAPILIVLGLVIEVYAIFKKQPK